LNVIGFSFLLLLSSLAQAQNAVPAADIPAHNLPDQKDLELEEQQFKRIPKYHFSYIDRPHSWAERSKHLGAVYALSWGLYPATQPDVVRNNGSFKKYRHNFGQLVFDQDEPFWNWIVHPISGSQLFLLYRSLGYSRPEALGMTFVSSTLFEFTIEIYTEKASIQDLYQTPVIGSIMGVGIENLSLYLLNSGNLLGTFFGHLINPATLFWFYEGKIRLTPVYRPGGASGLNFAMEF
jgi:hypothetical protein